MFKKTTRKEKDLFGMTGDYCCKIDLELIDCDDLIDYIDSNMEDMYYSIDADWFYLETDEYSNLVTIAKRINNVLAC